MKPYKKHGPAAPAIDGTLYATVAEACVALGVTRPTVIAMIARKELRAEHVAGRFLVVLKSSLPATAKAPAPTGDIV